MAFFVKLVNGVDYQLGGKTFFKNIEVEVDEHTYDYLKNSSQFEVSEGQAKVTVNTEDELKSLLEKDRKELNEIADGLELNPKDYKTKEEIAKAILKAENQ